MEQKQNLKPVLKPLRANGKFSVSVLASLLLCWITTNAHAGGGPENVFLVVNSQSWASRAIANHYIAQRDIPGINVFELPWTKSNVVTDITTFRDEILKPILAEINRRKLGGQIDYIVYASDYPYRIDFKRELALSPENVLPLAKRFPSGSITGLTYLAPLTLPQYPAAYTGLNSNWYFRPYVAGEIKRPTRAFHSQHLWDKEGEVVEKEGIRYLGCTMLGYTSGRGNSVQEIVEVLRQSPKADNSRPTGTIYFAKNKDIRSTTRDRVFPSVVAGLKKLGVRGEIVEGPLPKNSKGVAGAVMGSDAIPWETSGNDITPGAICEHLTSFGGVMHEDGGQTPISVLVRGGATGTSGTVIEPYALQQKFPHPAIHLHYASGSNLAESFYQSVQAPYQLLILGDPLCQPWARVPMVSVPGWKTHEKVSGKKTLKPVVELSTDQNLKHVDIYLDGQRISKLSPESLELEIDTTKIPDGYHEIRVVAVEDSLLEITGRMILPIVIDNHGGRLSISTAPLGRVRYDEKVTLSAHAPNAEFVYFLRGVELLGGFEGSLGAVTIDASTLGMGPNKIRAVALLKGESKSRVFSEPVQIEVLAPRTLEAEYLEHPEELVPGMELQREDGTRTVVEKMKGDAWYQDADVHFGESLQLTCYVYIEKPNLFQFQIEFSGEVAFSVGHQILVRAKSDELDYQYAPVQLAKGWHKVKLDATTVKDGRLRLYFGDAGAQTFDAERFYHLPFESQPRIVTTENDGGGPPNRPPSKEMDQIPPPPEPDVPNSSERIRKCSEPSQTTLHP
jgi:hypothetical protein